MNRLSEERQAQVVKSLVEGNSIRSTARITGTAINTVVKLLIDLGSACLDYQDTISLSKDSSVMKSGASSMQRPGMYP